MVFINENTHTAYNYGILIIIEITVLINFGNFWELLLLFIGLSQATNANVVIQ